MEIYAKVIYLFLIHINYVSTKFLLFKLLGMIKSLVDSRKHIRSIFHKFLVMQEYIQTSSAINTFHNMCYNKNKAFNLKVLTIELSITTTQKHNLYPFYLAQMTTYLKSLIIKQVLTI